VKWLGTRAPIEEYERSQVYGTANTNWADPWNNYVIPWFSSTFNSQTAQSRRAREITNYTDHLTYIKNRKLQNQAMMAGNRDLANQFGQRAGSTLVALQADQPNFWKNVYRAMPPAERPYFNVFAGATGVEEQERIMEAVPEYMRHIYIGLWKKKMPMNDQFSSPLLQSYAESAKRVTDTNVDHRVSEYFSQYPTPPDDWAGWHPAVEMDAVRVKMAQNEGIDVHQMGMWESQAMEAERMYPFVEPVPLETNQRFEIRDDIMNEMHRNGYQGLEAVPVYAEDDTIRLKFKRRKRDFYKRWGSPFHAARYSAGEW
jgi:hypothetical protein